MIGLGSNKKWAWNEFLLLTINKISIGMGRTIVDHSWPYLKIIIWSYELVSLRSTKRSPWIPCALWSFSRKTWNEKRKNSLSILPDLSLSHKMNGITFFVEGEPCQPSKYQKGAEDSSKFDHTLCLVSGFDLLLLERQKLIHLLWVTHPWQLSVGNWKLSSKRALLKATRHKITTKPVTVGHPPQDYH